jgi:hypothetical protein
MPVVEPEFLLQLNDRDLLALHTWWVVHVDVRRGTGLSIIS